LVYTDFEKCGYDKCGYEKCGYMYIFSKKVDKQEIKKCMAEESVCKIECS